MVRKWSWCSWNINQRTHPGTTLPCRTSSPSADRFCNKETNNVHAKWCDAAVKIRHDDGSFILHITRLCLVEQSTAVQSNYAGHCPLCHLNNVHNITRSGSIPLVTNRVTDILLTFLLLMYVEIIRRQHWTVWFCSNHKRKNNKVRIMPTHDTPSILNKHYIIDKLQDNGSGTKQTLEHTFLMDQKRWSKIIICTEVLSAPQEW